MEKNMDNEVETGRNIEVTFVLVARMDSPIWKLQFSDVFFFFVAQHCTLHTLNPKP